MHKRIFALLGVLFVLFSCTVMAFAEGSGTGSLLYSVIPFDTLYTDTGYTRFSPWVGSKGKLGGYYADLTAYSSYQAVVFDQTADIYWSRTTVELNNTYCRFYAGDVVVNQSVLAEQFVIYFASSENQSDPFNGNYTVSGTIVSMTDSTDGWVETYYPFSYSLNGTYAPVGRILANKLSEFTDRTLVRVKDLTVNVVLQGVEDFPATIMVKSRMYTSQPTMTRWLDSWDLESRHITVVNPSPGASDFDLIAFFDEQLESIFGMELMPGVSIAVLVGIAIGLGILLGFLKLTHGG